MKKVGLLGGTFDPPHYGHLLIAEEVYQALELDEVWFIPSYEPPHKEKANIKASDRVAMLKNAISDNDHFSLNTLEIDRLGKSYTYDTIVHLKEKFPTFQFYFIIGADMVEFLPKWNKIEELIQLVDFVGVKRNDYQLVSKYPIIEVNIPGVEISSTMIRQRIRQGHSIRYLIPTKVEEFIKELQLYES
ncbi:nicotinate-nucleotide adenylyltransferase [Aquibacillus kalidii]|uniref:nicotinate-nucleotide adenylyltransferase n=1 Tax=Aquibacillus kalidii TaxID=2762597 RepID=UPI0016490FC3|nr:nicotinate-nucleotide adenylyltransferase [Aquibacillus kalidii]